MVVHLGRKVSAPYVVKAGPSGKRVSHVVLVRTAKDLRTITPLVREAFDFAVGERGMTEVVLTGVRPRRQELCRLNGRDGWCGDPDSVEQGDEADEAFGGTVTRQKCRLMPAPANFGRGHRFAAYPRCWADRAGVRQCWRQPPGVDYFARAVTKAPTQ